MRGDASLGDAETERAVNLRDPFDYGLDPDGLVKPGEGAAVRCTECGCIIGRLTPIDGIRDRMWHGYFIPNTAARQNTQRPVCRVCG